MRRALRLLTSKKRWRAMREMRENGWLLPANVSRGNDSRGGLGHGKQMDEIHPSMDLKMIQKKGEIALYLAGGFWS